MQALKLALRLLLPADFPKISAFCRRRPSREIVPVPRPTMTEEQLGRVFECFSQAATSISRRFGGTGLSLTLTRQYCEMIGGLLTVKSTPGQGTTFTLKVPTRLPDPVI